MNNPAQPITSGPIPVLRSTPQVESKEAKKSGFKIVLIVFLAILVILSAGAYIFFTHTAFKTQRALLFKNIFLGLHADDNTIPSPIKISNPYVLQFDIQYILQAKILQITPLANGVELTTDLPEFRKIQVQETTPIHTGWEESNFKRVGHEELRIDQNIKISIDYMSRSREYKLRSILIDK